MRYALSNKFWEIPIEASDLSLDYEAYKEMRLVCPACGQPVFLVKGSPNHSRILSSGKVVKVSASEDHFSHFSGDDAKCELKAARVKSRLENAAVKTFERDQRFKKLTSRFWKIYAQSCFPNAENMTVEEVKVGLGNDLKRKAYVEMTLDCLKSFLPKYINNEEGIRRDIAWVKSQNTSDSEFTKYTQELIIPVQVQLAKEILKFLSHKRNKRLLEKVILWNLYIGHLSGELNWISPIEEMVQLGIAKIVLGISTFKWLEAFEELEK